MDTLRVRQLREWASQELERHGASVSSFGPAVTRLSDMGGPRPPDADQAPAAATRGSAGSRRGGAGVRRAATRRDRGVLARGPADVMTRVLVTGAGGAAGVSVIRALLADGVDPVAGDPDPLAAGCHLVDERVVLPYATDTSFASTVVRAATTAGVDAVICTVAEEMPALAAVAADLEAAGIATWLPPVDAVRTCIDKERFASVVAAAGLPAPATRAGGADGVPGPWVVKPRFGRGSRSVSSVDDAADLPSAIRRTPEPLVQTRCPGREFTVDALDRSRRSGGRAGPALAPRDQGRDQHEGHDVLGRPRGGARPRRDRQRSASRVPATSRASSTTHATTCGCSR